MRNRLGFGFGVYVINQVVCLAFKHAGWAVQTKQSRDFDVEVQKLAGKRSQLLH